MLKEHPLNTVDMFVHTLWQNDKHMISSWWFSIQDMKCCFADLCVLFKGSICQPWRMGQILAYMAFCEVSQEQTPGSAAYAGDFGFKVLTASDPAEKTKKLNAEIANGRLAMMAIIGMFFQAGIGVCADIACYNSTRKKTPRRVWQKECNNVGHQQNQHKEEAQVCVNSYGVFWVYEVSFLPATSSAHHMFDCSIVLSLSYLLIFSDVLANQVSWRMCREWRVSWCDMHRLYHSYNTFEACRKTWHMQIWYFSCCWLSKLYAHCARLHFILHHSISQHFILYHIISNGSISHQISFTCFELYHVVSFRFTSWHTMIF